MIQPALQDEAFLVDVSQAAGDPEGLHLWWLGQSGFLVQWQGRHLLLDPYLSDSLTRKYAGTDKPHVRMTERVIAPERLGFVEAVTSSHNHTDHLDAETLLPLIEANPNLEIVVGRANLAFAGQRLQVEDDRLTPIEADGHELSIGPFVLRAIPSAHEQVELDENGEPRCLGMIIEAGGRTIYHSGDCIPYEGLVDRLKRWRLDAALLPVNGRDPARGVPGNFTAEEAVRLGLESGARLVIPCHYDMFEFNTVSPSAFIEAAERHGQGYRVLRCGERLEL